MTATLYSKKGCHLCDEVMEIMEEFSCTVTVIDIDNDETAFAKYRYKIPVLIIGGATLQAPITRDKIRAALT